MTEQRHTPPTCPDRVFTAADAGEVPGYYVHRYDDTGLKAVPKYWIEESGRNTPGWRTRFDWPGYRTDYLVIGAAWLALVEAFPEDNFNEIAVALYAEILELADLPESIFYDLSKTEGLQNGNTESPFQHIQKQFLLMREVLTGKFRGEELQIDPAIKAFVEQNFPADKLTAFVFMCFAHDFGKIIGATHCKHPGASAEILARFISYFNNRAAGYGVRMPEGSWIQNTAEEQVETWSDEDKLLIVERCTEHHIFADLNACLDPDFYHELIELRLAFKEEYPDLFNPQLRHDDDPDDRWEIISQRTQDLIQSFTGKNGGILNTEQAIEKFPFIMKPDVISWLYLFTLADVGMNRKYHHQYGPVNDQIMSEIISAINTPQQKAQNQLAEQVLA